VSALAIKRETRQRLVDGHRLSARPLSGSLFDSYVYGFVLQEVSLPFGPGDDMGEMVDEIIPAEMLAAFPHLAELTTEHVLRPGYQHGDEFAFGIELVVDGLLASI